MKEMMCERTTRRMAELKSFGKRSGRGHVRTGMVLFFVLLCGSALGSPRTLEAFDASWSDRWWLFLEGGYSPSVVRKDMADGQGGYLDIKGKGPGYGIIQSKVPLLARINSLKETPIGMTFRVSGGKKGTFLSFEMDGNRKTGILLNGEPAWTTVNVPFANFSPAISFAELKKAGFVQFNLHGEMNFKLASIGWMYPPKYDSTRTADLVLADFQTSPNLEYDPLMKAGSEGRVLRLAETQEGGWLATSDGPKADAQGIVGFEAQGTFDEGGCPDWAQARGVTLIARGSREGNAVIELRRDGENSPVASAPFQLTTRFREIRIPSEEFDGSFRRDISGVRIVMPAGMNIELKRVETVVPEGMFRQEMEQRGRKNIRYYRWRNEVFLTQGLEFKAFEREIAEFERLVREKDFGRYYDRKRGIDRLYWYGIEVLALRAMNEANADRAVAAKDEPLLSETKQLGEKISTIMMGLRIATAGEKASLPALEALYASENQLAAKTIALIRQKNLRPYVKGRQYYSPSGKPIHFYGPHSFTASRKGMLRRQDVGFDITYTRLAAFGFTGIRFEAEENRLMPAEDVLDANNVKNYREGIETAWKYGLWVQYDNHFYFPGWVCQGSKAFPNTKIAGSSNSYQNLDGTLKIWKMTADLMKDMQNIFVFETPSNEPMFYDQARSILDIPSMMHEWNQFLKRKYGTAAKLNESWTRNVECPKENALQAGENWDKDSVLPPGFSEKALADMKNQSVRVADWIEFARYIQGRTTGAISKTVREVVPTATFMQQYIIANEWDRCPIPMNYHAILQVQAGASIFLGSHYGVAGKQVLKAISLGTPSTDSENPGEGNYPSYLTQKLLGSGATVFADYARWGGGMLWENDSCDYKESTAYVPLIADFFVRAEPRYEEAKPKVIVIEPTRLSATQQNDSVNDILGLLERSNVAFRLFEEHYVVDHPETLDKFGCAIVNLSYADTRLLDLLKSRPIKVFLFGSPYKDAYTRVYPEGVLGWLVKNGVILRSYSPTASAEASSGTTTINLEGNIKFKYDEAKSAEKEKWYSPEFDDTGWGVKPVPGHWGELGLLGSRKYFFGDGWYRFHVKIPAEWKEKEITLRFGAIDDTDDVYVNGKFVARTTTSTPNWWIAPRSYAIPNDTLRFGRENVIAVKVTNTLDDAGIYQSPVSLSTRGTAPCRMTADFGFLKKGEAQSIVMSREHFYPATGDLAATATVLAEGDKRAALVRDRQFVLCSLFLQIGQTAGHEKMLVSFLKDAGVDVSWPVKQQAIVYPFTRNYFVVRGAPDEDVSVRIKGSRYKHVGMEVLRDPRQTGDAMEFTAPKGSLGLIQVW